MSTSSVPAPYAPQKPKPTAVEHPVIPSGLAVAPAPRRVVGGRIQRSVAPLAESFLGDKHRLVLDQALFMSRSFRMGWGPRWTAGNVLMSVVVYWKKRLQLL